MQKNLQLSVDTELALVNKWVCSLFNMHCITHNNCVGYITDTNFCTIIWHFAHFALRILPVSAPTRN